MDTYKKLLFLAFVILMAKVSAQDEKFTLSGYVKDSANGEVLTGTLIAIPDQNVGAYTNEYGFYSINLPKGSYEVIFNYDGYFTKSKNVALNADVSLTIELSELDYQMEELVIQDEQLKANIEDIKMSTVSLDIQTMKKIPAFMGEVDIIKTIQLLPGIQSAGEGNSGFFVRGGTVDQNLILLDEATVFNASHLLGFFSVFNSDAVKDLQIYKGGVPARFGGRLSSVLDVHMKEGNSKKFKLTGGVGTIASRLTAEAPINKGKGSFVVSGRRTYADLFLKFSSDEELRKNKLYFYDFNAKANYELNKNNRIYLSGYLGRDVFKFGDQFSMDWGNITATLRWNHLFNDKLFANTTLIYSDFEYKLGISVDQNRKFEYDSRIKDYSGKIDFSFFANPKNTIRFGFQSIHYTFFPGVLKPGEESIFNESTIDKKYALESGIYLSNEQKIGSKLGLKYGLRLSNFNIMGKGTVYEYEAGQAISKETTTGTKEYSSWETIKSYWNLEPRLAVRYTLNEESSIKFSYNRMAQYLHLATNSSAALPFDLWVPSSQYIKPQISNQAAIGYFRNFKNDAIETSVEVYYKIMDNIPDFKDYADLLLNKQIETEFLFGQGTSYGLELFVRKNTGKLNGWISYTLSKSERKINGISNGNAYAAPSDRRHNLSIVAMYDLNKRWSFGATWVMNTGKPATFPSGSYMIEDNVISSYTERNAYRYPLYHRLDLSVTLNSKEKENKKINSSWNFSLYNAYGRKNPYTIGFRENEDNPGQTEAYKIYLFSFLPAITWNFKF